MTSHARVLGAEALGTTIVILSGPGTAVLVGGWSQGPLLITLGFGLGLAVATVLVGPRSGAQLNPAVTLGLLIGHRIDGKVAAVAWIGQVLGAAMGGGAILAIAAARSGFERGALFSNGWGDASPGGYDWPGVVILEVAMTALVVLTMLTLVADHRPWSVRATVMGAAMTVVAVLSGPVSQVGANPARSLATAVYADPDTSAMGMVWLFLLLPIAGAVLGVVLWLMIAEERLEQTGLFLPPVAEARDLADRVVERAVEVVDDVVEHAGHVDDNR